MAQNICNFCSETFTVKREYLRHVNKHCSGCGQFFSNTYQLKFHQKNYGCPPMQNQPSNNSRLDNIEHANCNSVTLPLMRNQFIIDQITGNDHNIPSQQSEGGNKFCNECHKAVRNMSAHLRSDEHRRVIRQIFGENINIVKNSFGKNILTFEYINAKNILLPNELLSDAKETIVSLVEKNFTRNTPIKFNIELIGEYVKPTSQRDEPSTSNMVLNTSQNMFCHMSKMSLITEGDNISQLFHDHANRIINKMSEFQERDSGWALEKIVKLNINIYKANLTRGSQFLKTPLSLSKKNACLNIRNYDEFCFKWCIVAALSEPAAACDKSNPQSYNINITEEIIYLPSGEILNFRGLSFPMAIKNIKDFEANNEDISINVFGYDGNQIVGPYYLTPKRRNRHINLMLLHEGDKFHYILIMDMSRLLRSQITAHRGRSIICDGCIQSFTTEAVYAKHEKECVGVVTEMPKEGENIIRFKNYHKKERVPFVIYADAECILEDWNPENLNTNTNTVTVKRHIPCAFSYYIKCSFNDSLSKFYIYSGPNAARNFLENLIGDCKFIYNTYLSKTVPMISLSQTELDDFNSSTVCHICEKELGNDRVKDHCHLTGKYRGAAHNECNLKYHVSKFVPIFFHNFSSYDCHLFFKELIHFDGEIKVIPLNKELYVSMSYFTKMNNDSNEMVDHNSSVNSKNKWRNKFELRFLDSFRFMSSSLDSLAKNLPKNAFQAVRTQFPNDADFNLLTRKGVFPYEYVSSLDKLYERKLPNRNEFYNRLTDSECSLDDYRHAQNVWRHFECQTVKDYMELYLTADVLLLADVFENFRSLCLRHHRLDPCQYFTVPSLSWDAMLLCTGVELELFTDINMYNFCKNGIRGGLTQCSNRHSVANSKYTEDYDPSKPEVNIYYLDVNNLYGKAMTQCLPQKDFKFLTQEELEIFNDVSKILAIPHDSPTGYFFNVDLEYPKNLHDKHNDLPFCPESKCVGGCKIKKLIADLNDKTSYTIDYRVLQQCIQHNLILKKINSCLQFTQSNWLAAYIMKNNNLRAQATDAFAKNFYKFMNNSVYGKTMENVDKRKIVEIRNHWESYGKRWGAREFISKPNFHSLTHFSDEMVAIQMNKVRVKYDKPIYLGFCILELSKWVMYDFFYDFLKVKFGNDFILNYMDTDSFILTFTNRNLFAELSREEILARFDTSDFSPSNPYNIPLLNKKVIGMMKDENCGKTVSEFVGLRPKMYAMKVHNSEEVKKSKGVKKSVMKQYTIDTYRDCLYNRIKYYNSMYTFRSRKHEIYTDNITKVCLSFQDDKRFIREDGVSTYAWGHYKLKNDNEDEVALSNEENSVIPMELDFHIENASDNSIFELIANVNSNDVIDLENISISNFPIELDVDINNIPPVNTIDIPLDGDDKSIFELLGDSDSEYTNCESLDFIQFLNFNENDFVNK
ncbi:uncharacterized protein LOC131803829 [Musca domestica]|uniref:Uncharacterized protein LOC131803828 n=1 Tax=Musca domestica TaxID=7370 RepID=A0ABM3V6X2_MUSDO|nr:uncharacterized protein LOC131803828 [Musca domestica]XP_058981534.1 uncharacterized protein LOC131803829 [Musca domestica]